jgi:glyoxylase-like metal-dependent hydrolase (beta-lactamase superfamily II)
VTVELEEPEIVWCGDLVWNGMFPNYVDAVPSQLTRHTEAILARKEVVFVPGHGDLPDADQLASYRAVIGEVERAARVAHERGVPAVDAAKEFKLPDSLGTWTMFAPDLYERAFKAWERELDGKP